MPEKAGQFPFTRGIYPNMYRERLWTMRQYAGFTSAEESNRRYRYLLEQGVTGLSIAFDLPTQMGYDSDHAMSEGEVGRVGVPIATIEDMEMLLRGIPLGEVSISMTINSTAAILLAFYSVVAEESGVAPDSLRGTVQNDILKEYVSRGTHIFPPEASLRIVTDIFEHCHRKMPKWNTISVSGYHIREAGTTAAQELAFTFCNGIAYVEAAVKRGLRVDDLGPQISFFFNAQMNFFEEIAKFRAARRLWAKIMKERFGAKHEKSMMCRFHVQTAGSSLAARQIDNNVSRTAFEALAAVLGGAQSIHTNARDEALALPTEKSARLALRTQQLIAHEIGVTETVDPLGGSWYVEQETDRLEEEAFEIIAEVDALGGAVAAIETGYIQDSIVRSAYEFQKGVDSGERVIVGVNQFERNEAEEIELQEIDQESVSAQLDRLEAFRKKRNRSEVEQTLSSLTADAEGDEVLMPAIIECARARCTLGEITDALRFAFGEYRTP
ncbi:MAG: methylmalonyl-CoA mutase family protein [Candidatus Neomarinimicrobiota bacterium]|nr:methylmalonyl-CoA mutase family protein [Candidatus Neomarinimicrobiota bacterium]